MADRLNVILVSRASLAKSAALTEAIVGNLVGRPGIDLVLVAPLSEITEDSTDRLTLLAMTSAVAVLTWTPAPETISDLHQIGFDGWRCPHAGDPHPDNSGNASESERSIYAVDLQNIVSAEDLADQLDRLRKAQSIQTFAINGNSHAPRVATRGALNPSPPAIANKPPALTPPPNAEMSTKPVDSDETLDDLIDRLDQFDV